MILYNNPVTQSFFDKIIKDARTSDGDLYHGTAEEGFACYYYLDGIKCDFGIGPYTDYEKLISEMHDKPEVDLTKHLMISGFVDSYTLFGDEWMSIWKNKAMNFPRELQVVMVNHFKKFYPEWILEKMGIERGDTLFYYESILGAAGNMFGILCALNKMYHPGKLKGAAWTIDRMEIKPVDYKSRINSVFSLEKSHAVDEVYMLIREVLSLIDKHLPEVNTEKTRKMLGSKLRK